VLPGKSSEVAPADLGVPLELVVLALRDTSAICRRLDDPDELILRTDVQGLFPGQIITVLPRKQWRYGRKDYISGIVESGRLEVPRLGLTPLRLDAKDMWDPAEEFSREDYDVIPDWAEPMLAQGPRRVYEMEQVVPGDDPNDPWSDPILQAVDRSGEGDRRGARRILMDLCRQDLRCLDAHSHLGWMLFDFNPADAVRHYETGVRIGELSLGVHFDGLLSWGWIHNRPYLRCLSGFGLCLWRLRRLVEAAGVFSRMLWLNPKDNQGVRFLVDDVKSGVRWEDRRDL
jgi:hypothetical protein